MLSIKGKPLLDTRYGQKTCPTKVGFAFVGHIQKNVKELSLTDGVFTYFAIH
jgi:hypothetical protein